VVQQYSVHPVADPASLRVFLEADRDYTAYALCDLEPPYVDDTTWYAASAKGELAAVVMFYSALVPPVLFLSGLLPALDAILGVGAAPDTVFFTARPETLGILKQHYLVKNTSEMLRMTVTSRTFTPLPQVEGAERRIIPLEPRHSASVSDLLNAAANHDGRDPDDIAFGPEMLEAGTYQGVFINGRLIAAAGTHVIGHRAGIAALGNVVVHPDFRRQQWGTRIAQAVTGALLDAGIGTVVLNVAHNNIPAVRAYRRLGFTAALAFIEGSACRRFSGASG
jgi:RimJ/RimL family protein N-acetyltransferase